MDFDLRRDEPYLAYGELPTCCAWSPATEGDCLARFEVLLEPGARLPGPGGRLPGPAGRAAAGADQPAAAEGAQGAGGRTPTPGRRTRSGINGYYLVSQGEKTPWRLKLRSASFNNVQVLGELLPGNLVADMVAILGSMFFVVGDIDK